MKPGAVLQIDGRSVTLGEMIGRGGEGEVFRVEGAPDKAIKCYTVANLAERERKIAAMVKARIGTDVSNVAFPLAIARTQNNRFAGFLMSLVREHRPLHELYGARSRRDNFPDATHAFTIRAAVNLARAVAAAHQKGCVIGDINANGMLVGKDARIALIDADSFQFRDGSNVHLCKVGTLDYTPPELQGRNLGDIARNVNHDAFGLAVLLFQIIFLGRHPFSGRPRGRSLEMQEAITTAAFAYSLRRRTELEPPPGALLLEDMPHEVQQMFEAALAPPGPPRPTAAQWVQALERLERGARVCGAVPSHRILAPGRPCGICRLERQSGGELFPRSVAPQPSGSDTTNDADLLAEIRNLALPDQLTFDLAKHQVAIPTFPPPAPPPPPPPPPPPKTSGERLAEVAFRFGFPAIFAVVLLAAGANPIWPIIIAIGGVIYALQGGDEPVAPPVATPRELDMAALQRALVDARRRLETAARVGLQLKKLEDLHLSRAGLEAGAAALVKQAPDLRAIERTFTAQHFEAKHAQALVAVPVRGASIQGISSENVRALAKVAIASAEDVLRKDPTRAVGIGPVKSGNLKDWARRQSTQVRVSPTLDAAAMRTLSVVKDAEIQKHAAEKTKLYDELRRLHAEVQGLSQLSARRTPEFEAALHAWAKAVGTFRAAGGTDTGTLHGSVAVSISVSSKQQSRPSVAAAKSGTAQAAHSPPRSTPKPQANGGAVSCPVCGGGMQRRRARKGPNAGGYFWGCDRYPICRGTKNYP
jgi:DNA-binding helix-hairpin-helix protein with protein kinase domain